MSEGEKNSLFAAFTASGDNTALGMGHAVTAVAQNVENSDRSAELEGAFWNIVSQVAAAEARA